jgi:WD40 repeat protein
MNLRWSAWWLILFLAVPAWGQTPDGPTAIFVMKPDGGEVRKLAEVDGFEDHEAPRWSHDGKRVVFDARNTASKARSCFIVNADGSGLREVAKGKFADFSPDDQQICFQADGLGPVAIYVQNLDGQGLTKIGEGRCPRWSPTGNALIYTDGTMLYSQDLVTDERIQLLPAPVPKVFDGVSWSPDGNTLAVTVRTVEGRPRELLFIKPAGGTQNLKPRLKNEMGGFTGFSADGKKLVFSDGMQMRLVEVAGTGPPRMIPDQKGKAKHPAFSPDGQWIAFSSNRKMESAPQKAAMPTAKRLQEVRRHDRRSVVWSVDFTPDGRSAVLGGANGVGVQVWDLTNDEKHDLGGKGMLVSMFPDGRRFATAWTQRTAHIVDIKSGEVLREIDHGGRIWAFAVSPDGRQVLTGGLDKILRIWDADTGDQTAAFDVLPDYALRAFFTPDSKEIIIGCHDNKLRVVHPKSGKARLEIEHPAPVWSLAATQDGQFLLTGTGGRVVGSLAGLEVGEADESVLRVWDRQTGKLVREMKGHEQGVFCIDVSPDGRMVATGGAEGTLRLWDLSTGEELSKIGPTKGIVACVRFSPDGKQLIAGGGISRVAGETIEFPNEQVRVFKVLDAAEVAAGEAKAEAKAE